MPSGERRRRRVVVLLLGGCAAAGTVAYAAFSGPGETSPAAGGSTGTGTVVGGNRSASPSPAPDGPAGRPVEGTFSISGRVSGLLPGVPTSLPLTITNPNPWPIRVVSVAVLVGTPPSGACPSSTLSVGSFAGSVRAPGRGSAVVTVPVRLADSVTQDQTGCPGTAFPLEFTGLAERAGR